jgi:hypothetical protein
MIIASNEKEYLLKFNCDEWTKLWDSKTISRITAYNKGYFRIDVKVTKIKDPFKTEVIE